MKKKERIFCSLYCRAPVNFNPQTRILNRNFISEGAKYDGEPDGYKLIDYFLNPKFIPKKIDWSFFVFGWYLVLKYGFTNIKQWIAQGQYTRPSSLQYGGDKMQTGPKLIMEWLKKNISNINSV